MCGTCKIKRIFPSDNRDNRIPSHCPIAPATTLLLTTYDMKNRSAILSVCAVSMFITVYNLKAIFLGYIEVQETQPTFWGWNPKNEKDVVHAFQPFSSSSQAQIWNNTYTCRLGNGTVTFPLLPHFIIVGAQKAGTTALAEFLDMVPGLQGTIKRELLRWAKLDQVAVLGKSW